MELGEYLSKERGRTAAVARALHLAPAYLSQMASGIRPVPAEVARPLHELCERKVPLWLLRPRDWHRIWPELIGAEGAPAVPELVVPVVSVPRHQPPAERAAACDFMRDTVQRAIDSYVHGAAARPGHRRDGPTNNRERKG